MLAPVRKLAPLAALALALAGWGGRPDDAPPRLGRAQVGGPPNVLILVTDDQRQGFSMMPATRRFIAHEGVRYDNAFATTPLCCPSRASIFTGRYAHNTGVHTEADASEIDQETTLQYYLQQAGYRTALFGKYLNTWNVNNPLPYFDEWSFFTRSRHGYRGGRWDVNGRVRQVRSYSTLYMGRKATAFLERQAATAPAQPWFMYLATAAPHEPYTPEDRYRGARVGGWRPNPAMYETDRSDKPPYVRVQHARPIIGKRTRRHQFRTLMSVDDLVGRVMRTLRRTGDLDDTLVFYISDNGFLWAEHGITRKSAPYTPSVQVPFLMRAPGGPTGVDDRPVANIDIAPTVMDAAGLQPANAPMDGRSLLDTSSARDRMLLEYYDQPGRHGSRFGPPTWASIRTSDYQYVEYYGNDGRTVRFREYYDMKADPYQLDNYLGDGDPANDVDAVTLQFLSQQLARDRRCSGTSGSTACP